MTNQNNNNKRIAKNTMFLYFRQILIMAVSIYTSRVVLQALGVVDYGVYNVVGGMVAMFGFVNTALAQATQRFISFGIEKDSVGEQRKTFSMLLNIHALLALIIVILCESIGLWFFFEKMVIPEDRITSAFWVMQFSIMSLVITITQVPYNASLFGYERMDAYAYISILEVLLKLVSVISLKYYFSDKLVVYGILMFAVSTIIASICRIYCIRNFSSCHYIKTWSKELFVKLFNFTSWSLIGNFAYVLNGQGMNMLINIFFGPIYNAARGVASILETALSSFLSNFISAAIPQIIKSYASKDIDYMIKLTHRSTKFGFLLFMCLSIPFIIITTMMSHTCPSGR